MLFAQVINQGTGTSISDPDASAITLPNYVVPGGDNRAIIIYFSTSNLQGNDFDSPNEMGGFYPVVTFNGQTLQPQSAGKRQGSNLGTVLYFAPLGSGGAITSDVAATYTGAGGAPINGAIFLSAASYANVLQSGIIDGSIGNGSNASGPTVFVQSSPSSGYEGAITMVNLVTNDTPPPTSGSQQTTVYTDTESPYTIIGDFARADTSQGSSSFGYFTNYSFSSFRQYAYTSVYLKCATNCSNAAPLPLELLAFDGWADAGDVRLAWETVAEERTAGFEVQRSPDAERWQTLGFVRAAGFAADESTYDFVDEGPLHALGYYRLKQLDDDGGYTYSPVISVGRAAVQSLTVYPTLVTDRLRWSGAEGGRFWIYDAYGRLVREGTAGGTSIAVDLPAGVYHFRLQTDAGQHLGKFIAAG